MKQVKTDIAIIGGGIAGLWLLNKLSKTYNVVLIENEALGSGQSLASQGLILPRNQEVENKPGEDVYKIWQDCLNGFGDVDLRTTEILSDQQSLVSQNSLVARFSNFVSHLKYKYLTKQNSIQDIQFVDSLNAGQFYQLDAKVIDMRSLLESLAKHNMSDIYKADIQEYLHEDGQFKGLKLHHSGRHVELFADAFIFTAGNGNVRALRELGLKAPSTPAKDQTQIMIKGMSFALHGLYTLKNGHQVQVTAHGQADNSYVWYVSGQWLHQSGKTEKERIKRIKQAFKNSFPKSDFSKCLWACQMSQTYQRDWKAAKRQKVFFTEKAAVAWPANLTTTPLLVGEIEAWLEKIGVSYATEKEDLGFERVNYGLYPWEQEQVQWHK